MNTTPAEFAVIVLVVGFVAYWITESNRGKPLTSISSLPDIEFKVIFIDKKVVLLKPVFDTPDRYYLDRSLINPEIRVGDKISKQCDDEGALAKC